MLFLVLVFQCFLPRGWVLVKHLVVPRGIFCFKGKGSWITSEFWHAPHQTCERAVLYTPPLRIRKTEARLQKQLLCMDSCPICSNRFAARLRLGDRLCRLIRSCKREERHVQVYITWKHGDDYNHCTYLKTKLCCTEPWDWDCLVESWRKALKEKQNKVHIFLHSFRPNLADPCLWLVQIQGASSVPRLGRPSEDIFDAKQAQERAWGWKENSSFDIARRMEAPERGLLTLFALSPLNFLEYLASPSTEEDRFLSVARQQFPPFWRTQLAWMPLALRRRNLVKTTASSAKCQARLTKMIILCQCYPKECSNWVSKVLKLARGKVGRTSLLLTANPQKL